MLYIYTDACARQPQLQWRGTSQATGSTLETHYMLLSKAICSLPGNLHHQKPPDYAVNPSRARPR